MAVRELGSINILVDHFGNYTAEVNTDHANPNGLQLSEMLCDFADRINRTLNAEPEQYGIPAAADKLRKDVERVANEYTKSLKTV